MFTKLFKSGMSLDLARGRDSWCGPKGARPPGTRMISYLTEQFSKLIFVEKKSFYIGLVRRVKSYLVIYERFKRHIVCFDLNTERNTMP